jgi:hypothetical protein
MDVPVRRRRRDRWTPIAVSNRRPRSERLLCPISNTEVFGSIPELKNRNDAVLFPPGAIHLRYGQHFGRHRGFGFVHIWNQHFASIEHHDTALDAVRHAISRVLRPGASIHLEAGNRLECFRPSVGVAILELRATGNDTYYSVVTGGYVPRNAKGPRIGALA